MFSVIDHATSVAHLATLAGELALDLETDGPQSRQRWDQLHALLVALAAIGQHLAKRTANCDI